MAVFIHAKCHTALEVQDDSEVAEANRWLTVKSTAPWCRRRCGLRVASREVFTIT
jgi:hypothetical protein